LRQVCVEHAGQSQVMKRVFIDICLARHVVYVIVRDRNPGTDPNRNRGTHFQSIEIKTAQLEMSPPIELRYIYLNRQITYDILLAR
jgi:hypothetical protein